MLSAEEVLEAEKSEKMSRDIACWAGEEFTGAQLRTLILANDNGKIAFDRYTQDLFDFLCSTSDELPQGLFEDATPEEAINHFRHALWMYVIPALEEHKELAYSQRIKLYMKELGFGCNSNPGSSVAATREEVMA